MFLTFSFMKLIYTCCKSHTENSFGTELRFNSSVYFILFSWFKRTAPPPRVDNGFYFRTEIVSSAMHVCCWLLLNWKLKEKLLEWDLIKYIHICLSLWIIKPDLHCEKKGRPIAIQLMFLANFISIDFQKMVSRIKQKNMNWIVWVKRMNTLIRITHESPQMYAKKNNKKVSLKPCRLLLTNLTTCRKLI